jgi:ComF family protein
MMPGETGIICGHCWSRCRELPNPRCFRCGHPVGRYSCHWCELLPPFVRSARSYCWMGAGTGTAIVHALKYGGWIRVCPAMADRMARLTWPVDVVRERAAIVPVPLSVARLRDRGFNQSEILAGHLSKIWQVPVLSDALCRGSATRSQTQLTPGERLSNVAGAFSVAQKALQDVRGRHLVLLDDVVTTGSTLGACARALFDAGARTISYMTFGRAPASGDRLIP